LLLIEGGEVLSIIDRTNGSAESWLREGKKVKRQKGKKAGEKTALQPLSFEAWRLSGSGLLSALPH